MNFSQTNGGKFGMGSDSSPPADAGGSLDMADLTDDATLASLTAGAGKKKISKGSVIMVLVVVLACAGLWFMRNLARVSATVGGNAELEASIEKFIKSAKPGDGTSGPLLASSEKGLLEALNDSYTERQVPLSGVRRDPFVIPGEGQTASTPDLSDANSRNLAKRRNDRKLAIEQAGGRLQLKSVIMGSEPLAHISGKLVRKGEQLTVEDIVYKVKDITSDQVLLVAEDPSLDLVIDVPLQIKRDR